MRLEALWVISTRARLRCDSTVLVHPLHRPPGTRSEAECLALTGAGLAFTPIDGDLAQIATQAWATTFTHAQLPYPRRIHLGR